MGKRYCQNCGSEIELSNKCRFCGNCGFPVRLAVSNDSVVEDVECDPVPAQETISNNESTKSYNCYARYVSTKSPSAIFQEPDGNNLYIRSDKTAPMGELVKGEYYWVRVTPKEDGGKWTTPAYEDKGHAYLEYVSFASKYKQNDRLVLPVKSMNPESCVVSIGPTAIVCIPREEINKKYNSSDITPKQNYSFTVKTISKNDGKYNIVLEFSGSARIGEVETLYAMIPDTMADIIITYNFIKQLHENDDARYSAISRIIGPITPLSLAQFIGKEYQKQKKKKTLVIKQDVRSIKVDFDLGIKDSNGVPIRACVNKKKDREKFVLSLIGRTSPISEMERFVYVPDWEKLCEKLEKLALNEIWGYDENDKYSILKSYLKMTYYKARLDSLLIETDDGALFNTGLVDKTFDEIYCYLKKARSVDDPYDREWTPGFFACRGKEKDGKRLNELFTDFPPVPSYIHRDRIESIYFDTSKELSCDYSHILKDNLNRFPLSFVSQTLAYDSEVRSWSERHGSIDEIKEYVLSKSDLIKGLEDQLKSAIETAKKYCKWNYKTAIPIYYPRTNNISLLLPLCVVKGSSTVDTALVIQLLTNGNYQGQTILTLEMAYKDARQICRPNSEWLTLDAIKNAVHSEDEDSDD